MVNELFKEGIAGKDLKIFLLEFLNTMNWENFIAEFIRKADIATIYKGKGEKCNLRMIEEYFCYLYSEAF